MAEMAETGDLIQEFKNAKPAEKAVIIGGVLVVVGIAWYLHSKSQSQTGTTGVGDQGVPQTQTSGWGTVGPNQTPIEPPGYQPIFDPSGNLISFAPIPQPKQMPTPTPTPTPPPKPHPHGNPPPPPVTKKRNFDIIVRHNQPTQVASSYARRSTNGSASPSAPAWQPPAARMPPPNYQPTKVGTAGIPPIQYPVGMKTRIS